MPSQQLNTPAVLQPHDYKQVTQSNYRSFLLSSCKESTRKKEMVTPSILLWIIDWKMMIAIYIFIYDHTTGTGFVPVVRVSFRL